MKIHNNKEITAKSFGKKVIIITYLGTRLIWQAIKSCFGAGFWRNDKPWDNKEGYKN